MKESITLDDDTVICLRPEAPKQGVIIPMVCSSHNNRGLKMFLLQVSDLAVKWGVKVRGIETEDGSSDREVLMRLIGAQSIREDRMDLNPPWIHARDD